MTENFQYEEPLGPQMDVSKGQGDLSAKTETTEQEQPAVEALLSLDELNQKYAVNELCGPASMDAVKKGLPGINWVSFLRNSPFQSAKWEMFLGGYITDSANKGAWEAMSPGGNSQYSVEVGMFREVDTVGGQKLIPTEKCLKFIKERLGRYTE